MSLKCIFWVETSWVKCNSRERILFDTFGLFSSSNIFFIETIKSLIQKVWSYCKSTHDNEGPNDPGWSGLRVTDVGESMDWCGGEKLIHLPPEAPHCDYWQRVNQARWLAFTVNNFHLWYCVLTMQTFHNMSHRIKKYLNYRYDEIH